MLLIQYTYIDFVTKENTVMLSVISVEVGKVEPKYCFSKMEFKYYHINFQLMKNNLTIFMVIPILSVITITILLNSVYAQEENMTESEEPKFFGIQHAQSGSISEINDTAYYLVLYDVSAKTILFSDRPDRIVTSVSTLDFIGNWSRGEDSFSVDAPNAVLVVDESENQDIAIVELFNPVYDTNEKTLKYEVTPDNSTTVDLPSEFGQTTLIIDASPEEVDSQITD